MGDVSPRDVVEIYWPFDGPHSDETVADAAEAVARLVRYVANATWRPLGQGQALYRALSSLHAAVAGLDQVLRQLGEITAPKLEQDGSLYDDRRDRPAVNTVREVAELLAAARRYLDPAARRLQAAAQLACRLGHDVPAEPEVDNAEAVDW